MKYLVTGCTRLNDMNYPNDRKVEGFLGGAIYTVNGIKPYTDNVLFITTAGPDFEDYYGEYFTRNGLSREGIQFILPKTEYTILEYDTEGRWYEYSKYGPEYEKRWGPVGLITAEFVTKYADEDTRGIYFESSVKESVWQDLDKIRAAAPNALILWELPTKDCTNPEVRDEVRALINKIDIYSINLPESFNFFGTNTEAESIEAIKLLGKPCFFRVGEKGAYMIMDGKAWFAPAIDTETSVDATGCGNCSTGTIMYAFDEGVHPLKMVILANLAASLNAQQFGPYPHFTAELRKNLFQRADDIFNSLYEEQ
jgi:sugar/nucleoside kinase (ribokinase family)